MTRSPKLEIHNALFILDFKLLTWTKLELNHEHVPTPRLDHDVCLVPLLERKDNGISVNVNRVTATSEAAPATSYSLFLFGGMDTKKVLNDLHELSITFC
jgi:hypothetical protein